MCVETWFVNVRPACREIFQMGLFGLQGHIELGFRPFVSSMVPTPSLPSRGIFKLEYVTVAEPEIETRWC
jgi:hypothetical protein